MHGTGNSIAEVKAFLEKDPLFTNLGSSSLSTIAQNIRFDHVKKDQFIFIQCDPCDKVYIVHSGKISIILESPDGRKLVINEMCPGDIFGEIGLVTRQVRSSSAVARTDSELMVLPRQVFLQILDAEPLLIRHLLEMTMNRLRESTERESALAFLNAEGRLARLLLQMARQELEKGYITISQEELADRTGQTRQTVAKALGKWRRSGWLITGRGRIMLLNYDALAKQEMETSY